MDDIKLKEILLKENYVPEKEMEKAEEYAKSHRTSFIDYLINQGLISKALLGQAVAEFFKVPFANFESHKPSKEEINKIPENIAKKYHAIFYKETKDGIIVATDDPSQKALESSIRPILKKKIIVAYTFPENIESLFINYKKALETRFASILKGQKHVAPEILEEIFEDAISYRASDIHFEPMDKEVIIRFRIDGVLHEAGRIQKEYYENVLNRIKVQSKLRIDEHNSSQDGTLRYLKNEKGYDMRVSIIPTLDGEKAVLRVLSKYVSGFGMSYLGLSSRNEELLKQAAKKPFGMILVTGPTGSGKTTTLYALLKILNRTEVNVTTIEDPVEYKMAGVNQIQVNQQTNLTFAKGLRSIVRQDPDIILVGEIRDEETAEIAVNAALTGHLLLSTFHANDAATSIPRLLDMGIEPFLLSSTLELIIAQRLVRKICESCRVSKILNAQEAAKELGEYKSYFPGKSITVYYGKGCATCNNTGFSGRTAIFEFIPVTPEIKELMLTNPSSSQIWDLAVSQGAKSLFEDGLEKVNSGITTLEEVLRVASPPDKILKTVKKNEKKPRKNKK